MDNRRTPLARPRVLDVVLGVVVAMALAGVAPQVRTVAAIRTLDSIGRLSLLAGALVFAILYWIETNVVLRAVEKDDEGDGLGVATHPLSGAVGLGVVALLALMVAFATVENMGWFLGVTAVIWAIDLVALAILRGPAAKRGSPRELGFLLTYSGTNLALFAALAVWNALSPWGEGFRAGMAIALLAWVLTRHVIWRPRGLARARRA